MNLEAWALVDARGQMQVLTFVCPAHLVAVRVLNELLAPFGLKPRRLDQPNFLLDLAEDERNGALSCAFCSPTTLVSEMPRIDAKNAFSGEPS